jgi:hypothetical protein
MESEYINRKTKLIEYTKLHVISLEQDLENIAQEMESLDPESKACKELDYEYNYISGQSIATRHLLKTMEEML